jgi:radical SAM superfamily enzyme YgiQ (UPF0313 family)
MPDIVLTTLNAKYPHAAFGLRYLLANLGELQLRARLLEFDINQRPLDIAEALLAEEPRIIGLGVYIWNVTETTEVIAAIKKVRPEVRIVLGGPEVSYETEGQAIVALADHVITGEADLAFGELCQALLSGGRTAGKIIPAPLPDLQRLALPYAFYTETDIAHRVIYVEASRGCPFTCEFCLSSLDIPVRQFPLAGMLAALQSLLDRGVQQFKFVDRTFNLDLNTSRSLLQFFLERLRPGLFLHFEMIPDRLPAGLREVIRQFPPGCLQFEIGIQSFNEKVCELISRRQKFDRLEENLRFLRAETGVHIHADLIVGLPGETVDSFATGFDRLVALDPHEIQVGLLKRLRGTPIVRHDETWSMRYNSSPPYELLQNRCLEFSTVQRLRRFAKYWDLVANSGNFVETAPMLWGPEPTPAVTSAAAPALALADATAPSDLPIPRAGRSPFGAFLGFSDFLYQEAGRTEAIALVRLARLLFRYLVSTLHYEPAVVAESLQRDWQRAGRRDAPDFSSDGGEEQDPATRRVTRGELPADSGSPRRQLRHRGASRSADVGERTGWPARGG